MSEVAGGLGRAWGHFTNRAAPVPEMDISNLHDKGAESHLNYAKP